MRSSLLFVDPHCLFSFSLHGKSAFFVILTFLLPHHLINQHRSIRGALWQILHNKCGILPKRRILAQAWLLLVSVLILKGRQEGKFAAAPPVSSNGAMVSLLWAVCYHSPTPPEQRIAPHAICPLYFLPRILCERTNSFPSERKPIHLFLSSHFDKQITLRWLLQWAYPCQ